MIAPPPPTLNDRGFGQFRGSVADAVTGQAVNTGQVELTVDGTPLLGVSAHTIVSGIYETDVVPTGSGYRLDINATGYIDEKVFALRAPDRQIHEVDLVRLIPLMADGIGTISGHIGNALNNSNVPNLNIYARRHVNQRSGEPIARAVTDSNGNFTLQGLAAGNYTLEVQGAGYVTNYLTVVALGGQTNRVNGIVTPELGASQFRVVLTWGESPRDLDSHLTGPDSQGGRFHIYYGSRGSSNLETAPYAYLDRDDISSFGPETITIGRLQQGDVYRYSVHNYSNRSSTSSDALGLSGARVEVYGGNQLISSFNVPNQGGTLWTVFEIDEAGRLIPVNQLSYATRVDTSGLHISRNVLNSPSASVVTDYWQMIFQPDK